MRTEEGLRNQILTQMSDVTALANFGLSDSRTILDRPLNNYRKTERAAKISAVITDGYQLRIRSWSVQVVSTDLPRLNDRWERTYNVRIAGYYEPEDINLMIAHSTKIKEIMKALQASYASRLFDAITGASVSDPELIEPDLEDIDTLATMELGYTIRDTCPDY